MAKDVDLFVAAMTDVKPLAGRKRAKDPAPITLSPSPSPTLPRRTGEVARRAGGGGQGESDLTFDRDIDRALSRGKLAPEATLDLHGMTLAAAERAVARFLEQAVEQDCRVALIVTGKGLREVGGRVVGGRIRAEFAGWLARADNRARVRSFRAAHPRHGGSGAFYVLLRRRSSASRRSLRATPQR